jgi:hypothetical protein
MFTRVRVALSGAIKTRNAYNGHMGLTSTWAVTNAKHRVLQGVGNPEWAITRNG